MKKTASPSTNRLDTICILSTAHDCACSTCCAEANAALATLWTSLRSSSPAHRGTWRICARPGLVSVRRAGQWCYYSLALAKEPFHQKLLECLACCFNEVPWLRADQERARGRSADGGCCPEQEKTPVKKQSRPGREKSVALIRVLIPDRRLPRYRTISSVPTTMMTATTRAPPVSP